ncbi:MAG: hypothetical protein ABJA67_06350 [Chthonomonadales bacterium]
MKLFKRKLKLSKAKLLTCFGCLGVPVLVVVMFVADFYWRNRPVKIDIPEHAMPKVNARDDFLKAAALANQMVHTSPMTWPWEKQQTETKQDYALCAKDAEAPIGALRAGLTRPYVGLNPRAVANGQSTTIPYLNLVRNLYGAAFHYHLIGDHATATEIRLDGMEFAAMLSHGGTVGEGDLTPGCFLVIANIVEESISKLSSNQLDHVALRLEIIRSKLNNCSFLVEQKGNLYLQEFVDELLKRGGPYNRFDDYRNAQHGYYTPNGLPPVKAPDVWGWIKHEMRDKTELAHEMQNYYRDLAIEMSTSFHKTVKTRIPDDVEFSSERSLGTTFWAEHFQIQSMLDLYRLEVALLRFRADNRKYPATLKELSPKYLVTIPVDPFSNNGPYRYHKTSDGKYLLYGLNKDMIDHGGVPGSYQGDMSLGLVAGNLDRKVKIPKK